MRRLAALTALSGATSRYVEVRARKGLLGRAAVGRLWGPLLARLGSVTPCTAPLIGTVAITERCVLRCGHCSADAGAQVEPPFEQVAATLDALVASRCPVIALTGGEPLLRRDLPRLLRRIPDSRVSLLYTSGVGLTARLARDVAQGRHRVVCISVDHHDGVEHDRRRGYAGAYTAAMKGIDRLAGRVAEVHVASLVTRDRIDETQLRSFAHALRRRGVSCLQLFVPKPVGRQRRSPQEPLTAAEEQQLSAIAARLNRNPAAPLVVAYPTLESASGLGCCAGYARVYVDARGNVCPCDFAPMPFGNLQQESFAAIWQRMRRQFATPGRTCLAPFNTMADAAQLDRAPPDSFVLWGERTYRILARSLTLSAVAFEQREPPRA